MGAGVISNKVKQRLGEGHVVIGQWISLPSPAVAELVSSVGLDWLVIDTEHGPADWETVEEIVRAMKGTETAPFIRVPANDPALIKKGLDRGVLGVVVPLVSTAAQATAAVAAAKFPPAGMRGVAGTRASRYGLDLADYVAQWNQQSLVICQVETPEATQNAEAIAAVAGVDVLFVGPNDLSATLGVFRQFEHPDFKRAVDRILSAARTHRKTAGIMASSADDALMWIERGFRFVSVSSDARTLAAATAAAYEKVKTGLKERKLP